MRKRKNKNNTDDKAEIDLTPMLDVVFIMLIFFIVTASFLNESTIPLNQPDTKPNIKPLESSSLVINIDATDKVEIENRRVDIRSIRALVSQFLAENPGASTLIRAHEQASTEKYVAVANQIRQVSGSQYLLVTYSE